MAVEILEFESRVLKGNAAGDPHVRRIPVYLPPSYPRGRYPVHYMLTGFTGFGEMLLSRGAWTESLPDLLIPKDREPDHPRSDRLRDQSIFSCSVKTIFHLLVGDLSSPAS